MSTQNLRYEFKIPLQHIQFSELKSYLYQLGLYPRQAFPDRVVHSIYLDTVDFDDYLDNVTGSSKRKKIRIRWYDDQKEKLTLEIKLKTNRISRKLVYPLDNTNGFLPVTRAGLQKLLYKNSLKSPDFLQVYPILEVKYARKYYEFAPEIRMTIDQGIEYRRLYPIEHHSYVHSIVDAVVEFKCTVKHQKTMSQLLTGMPARIFRHSKYVIGVDSVCNL